MNIQNHSTATRGDQVQTENPTTTGTRYIRANQLLQQFVPFSPSTLRRKVLAGEFPQPVKLSARVVAWKLDDVIAWAKACETAGA